MMAQRYSLLPSEILERASTFDMVIMEMSLTYQNYLQNKDKEGYVPQYSPEQLEEIRRNTL